MLSFSPELFIRRDGERLTTRPMKGTAPRHPDRTEDERLGRELLASEKNRAENLMIVDLLRNDLGRLAEPGSVTVDALFSLERYPTVWTMTSTVSARAPRLAGRRAARAVPLRLHHRRAQDRRHAPHPPDGDRAARPVLRQHRLAGAGRRFR